MVQMYDQYSDLMLKSNKDRRSAKTIDLTFLPSGNNGFTWAVPFVTKQGSATYKIFTGLNIFKSMGGHNVLTLDSLHADGFIIRVSQSTPTANLNIRFVSKKVGIVFKFTLGPEHAKKNLESSLYHIHCCNIEPRICMSNEMQAQPSPALAQSKTHYTTSTALDQTEDQRILETLAAFNESEAKAMKPRKGASHAKGKKGADKETAQIISIEDVRQRIRA